MLDKMSNLAFIGFLAAMVVVGCAMGWSLVQAIDRIYAGRIPVTVAVAPSYTQGLPATQTLRH
jgi:hypothetical protein